MSLAGIVAKVGGCEGAALDVLERVEPISEFMILALSESRDRVPLRYAAQGQLLKLPRQPRGGDAASRCGTWPEVQGPVQCRLPRGAARFRGRRAEGVGCRL